MLLLLKKIAIFLLVLQIIFPSVAISVMAQDAGILSENQTYESWEFFVRGEVIVGFDTSYMNADNPLNLKNLQELLEKKNQKVVNVLWFENLVVIRQIEATPNGTEDLMREYTQHPFVLYVQPNYVYTSLNAWTEFKEESEELSQELQQKIEEIEQKKKEVLGFHISIVDENNFSENNFEKNEEIVSSGSSIDSEQSKEVVFEHSDSSESIVKNATWSIDSTQNNNTSNNNLLPLFNDEYYSYQWALENRGQTFTGILSGIVSGLPVFSEKNSIEDEDIDYEKAKEIYDIAYNRLTDGEKKDIIVAIIDDGVNYLHEDLDEVMWDGTNCKNVSGNYLGDCIHGYNFVTDEKDGFPELYQTNDGTIALQEHGTNIAGIIAAESQNTTWMVGVSPNVKIMALNIFDENGQTDSVRILRALYFAKENNADIINFSLWERRLRNVSTFNLVDDFQRRAMQDFPGMIVNAAGNNSLYLDDEANVQFPTVYARGFTKSGTIMEPLENMIVVGADDSEGNIADFSNYGSKTVDISAPGVNVLVTGRGSYNKNFVWKQYDLNNGTSFSAPIVAGALALAKSAYPNKSFSELRDIMYATVDIKPLFADKITTSGRLNLGTMMTRLEEWYQDENNPLKGEIVADVTDWTNKPVVLTLSTNKSIVTPENWTKISDTEFSRSVTENMNIDMAIVNAERSLQTANVTFSVKNIDTIKPTIALFSRGSVIETPKDFIALNFAGVDSGSGIRAFQCSINQQEWKDCISGGIIELTQEETNFSVRSVDRAENISEEVSVLIRKNPNASDPMASPWSKTTFVSGGSGGTYSSQILNSSELTSTVEENISLNSASETTSEQNSQNNSSDIYVAHPNAEITLEELKIILSKEWIQPQNTALVRRFSIGEKFVFLEAILNNINNKIATLENEEKEKMIQKRNTINTMYLGLMMDWKEWKFFILDITR